MPLQPSPSEGGRSRGRRVPSEGVLLIALLTRWRPDDEDRKQLLYVDGTTRLTGPNPVRHPPHEPPFDLQRKGSGGDRRGGPKEHAYVEYFGGNAGAAGGKGYLLPFLPGAQRRRMSTKVHGTTCAEAREMERRDNGLASDVRVSPDEGAGPPRGVTRGMTTQDCSQRISSVVTPNSKSTLFQSKPRSPCTERASRGRAVPGRPSWRTWGRCYFKTSVR